MGREFPQGENAVEIHPFITMSLFIASVSATVAVVSSLCGALSRKKTPPSSVDQNHEMKENRDVNIHAPSPTDDNKYGLPEKDSSTDHHPGPAENDPQGEESLQQPLPLPPGKRNMTGEASYHFRSNSTASTSSVSSQLRKLPASMSMRALGNGIGIGIGVSSRQASKRDHDVTNDHHKKNKDKKLKHEDSIWKKTIILGEKCKVPDEDDEDAILYDEKGNRIPTYHRKTTSMALSRQNSSIDPDAIPSLDQRPKDEILRNASEGGN